MGLLYAPSKYLSVEANGGSSNWRVAAVELPQALMACASILKTKRHIGIHSLSDPAPVQGQPIVHIRTNVEISARDISHLLLCTDSAQGGAHDPVLPFDAQLVADALAGPSFMPRFVSLGEKNGEWVLEILDFGPALKGIGRQMEEMKKKGFDPVYLVTRTIVGPVTVMVGVGVGPCKSAIWLGLGRAGSSLADLLAITVESGDSLRSWKILADAPEGLDVVAMAREERPGVAALSLVIGWQ
jgi:hypothetical protein